MSNSFYGLQIAKSGLVASQLALNITSNNIANSGTEGYTRQGINQSSASAYTGVYRYSASSVQAGKGVAVDSVAQYRDEFLDLRYRNANSTYSTYSTSSSVLSSIEGIVDETSNDGLITSLQDFYTSLENLSSNSGDVSYSSLARSGAKTVVGMFNQYSDQLNQLAEEQTENLQLSLDSVNSYIQKIDALNKNIEISNQNGSDCNELLDELNFDLDELSGYVDISVEENTDGTVSVLCGSTYLLNSQTGDSLSLSMDTGSSAVKVVDAGGTELSISEGSIKGVLQSLNGLGSYAGSGDDDYFGIAYYQTALDELASQFASTYNSLNGSDALFVSSDSGSITASTISLSDAWLSDASLIDTDNINNMIGALTDDVSFTSGFTGTFEEFATELMSENSTDVSYMDDMKGTYSSILSAIEDEREAISGVSTDEEAINTTQYEKAYQAAARVMTALDELLEKLINDTGVVGLQVR